MLATFKLVPRPQFFNHILLRLFTPYHTLSHLIPQVGSKTITSYHAFSLLITPYHTLSPRLETKTFSFGNFQISSQVPIFLSHLITLSHSLSYLITPYPLGWKQNHLILATFKLVSRPQFFNHILSCLVTPYFTLLHLIPQIGNKTFFIWQLLNQFSGHNLFITSYHAFSLLITPYHPLSPWLQKKRF